MPERFRGELLTMWRYTNPASFIHTDVTTVQISQCSKLGVLSLRNNNLSSLPPEIGTMQNLRVLDVIGNK